MQHKQLTRTWQAFLSTLSLRRATHINAANFHSFRISIHALLAESDRPSSKTGRHFRYFYPRSPCGERPITGAARAWAWHFYPRSPCGERRPCHGRVHQSRDYFYPRSPCGERRAIGLSTKSISNFYPRSPCGERLNLLAGLLVAL